ncbi:thiamine ABC transporter permease [Vibrio sp. SCSIO 43136]|uniref:ABC transporter permease n=1 Tax=Vibrio sp. SCSIO 43136 TaxID=2819101 RepID=UPI002074DF96|nr:thiamine ABC transporter permease [Vibrio sp. SCSIO 43136]USD63957.1 thiamine ABC transporter permease [Vibrio sp. SCSIO 43136]
MMRLLYLLVISICFLPTLPGIVGVALSAMSYVPAIGLRELSLQGFIDLHAWSSVYHSMALTFFSAITSTYLACLASFVILKTCWNTRWWHKVELTLSPLLAMPHVAFAIGFAFLFAPTGLGARLFDAVGLLNQDQSQLPLLVKDPKALGLIFALTLKEIPFLLLMSIPVLQQLRVAQIEKVSASMGYSRTQTWWKCILPLWIRKIRFPLFAVIAYAVSVVDMAIVLGPTNPPTFAVLVWQWFNEPDLTLFPRASAGAVVLFAIATSLIALVILNEMLICKGLKRYQYSGRSGVALNGKPLFWLMVTTSALIVPVTVLWSFSLRWRFPDIFPSSLTTRFWEIEWSSVSSTIHTSFVLATVTATITLLLAVIAQEIKIKRSAAFPNYMIAISMLVPQLSILFGIQTLTLYVSHMSFGLWVTWAHVFFAFPYVYLALDGPWRSFDPNYTKIALSLGKSPMHAWLKIKMPMLLPALLFGWAIGASVSLAQYLPTLMLGAGRITTLTTEAVAISSGSDRRVTAIYALWQALLPLLFFSFAILASKLPKKFYRNTTKRTLINEPVA